MKTLVRNQQILKGQIDATIVASPAMRQGGIDPTWSHTLAQPAL